MGRQGQNASQPAVPMNQGQGQGFSAPNAGGIPSQLPQLGGMRDPNQARPMPFGEMEMMRTQDPRMYEELRAKMAQSPWGRRARNFAQNNPRVSSAFNQALENKGFSPGNLPISATSHVAGTQSSPVAQAAPGGSGITDPASPVAAQPSNSTNNAPSQSPARQALQSQLLRRGGGGQPG